MRGSNSNSLLMNGSSDVVSSYALRPMPSSSSSPNSGATTSSSNPSHSHATEGTPSNLAISALTTLLLSPSTLVAWMGPLSDPSFQGTPYVDMIRNNMQVVGTLCLSYVTLVFWGKNYMANRKPYDLKGVTIAWNAFLALFSFICFFRFTAETWDIYNKFGSHGIICEPPPREGPHALWQLLFIASKVWEFGDTALLILRKKPLIFLHWYHHTSVLLLSCFIGGRNSTLRRVFANVNSGVHALMYTYYGFASAGVRAPKYVSMSITMIQLLQMVAGVYTCIKSLSSCNFSENSSAYFSLLIYFSYLVLFSHFFYMAYYVRRKKSKMA